MLPPLFFFGIYKSRVSNNLLGMLICVVIVYLLIFLKNPTVSLFRAVGTIGSFFNIASVLALAKEDKKNLLDFITNLLVIISIVSLFGWILHLVGFDIPVFQHVDFGDDVHDLENHYVYYDSYKSTIFFPRFRGIFIEPGQLATPLVFLFFARGAKIRDWKNLVLLLSVILSFSLSGYITLILGMFLNGFVGEARHKLLRVFVFSVIVGGIAFLNIKAQNENNALYSLIIARMEYDEDLVIAGNNRSDAIFDDHFAQYVKSDDIIFGMGDKVGTGALNWTNHSSGIKKFFLNYGIVGVLFMVLLTLGLLKTNFCPRTVVFTIVIWSAFIVRDLLASQFWLIIAILGYCNLKDISMRETKERMI
jgi:hypothetical protein